LVFTLTAAERRHQRAAAEPVIPTRRLTPNPRCNVERINHYQGQIFDSPDYIAMPAWASRSTGIRMFYVRVEIAGNLLHNADTAMVMF
jgi:hypothetical protein